MRSRREAGAESIAAYAARTTDICFGEYSNFLTKD